MNVAGVRAALRIARRDALRAKGRSALVVAMIGLPMFGLAAADIAVRTAQLPPSEVAVREIGAADLVAEQVSDGPIVQRDRYDYEGVGAAGPGTGGGAPMTRAPGSGRAPAASAPDGDTAPAASAPDVRGLLPPGSRVSVRHRYYDVHAEAAARATQMEVAQVDLADDLSRGLVRLRSGRFPTAADEALVTPRLARALEVGLGATVTYREARRSFRVVGIGVLPNGLADRVMFVPGAARLAAPNSAPGAFAMHTGATQWAVELPPGVRDVDLLPVLNQAGMKVIPRTWYANPPHNPYESQVNPDEVGVVVVVVGLATLEIVLLAGTAFAVGARRKQRELGLVAATGGDRGDVRRIVLAGGVVLGAVAGVLGIAGGIVAVVLARPTLERLGGALLGPLDVRPLDIAGIVAVAVGTALLATLLPARAAARQPVVAALTGRRGELRTPRRVPVFALLAIAVGAPLAFWAAGDGKVNAMAAMNGDSPVTTTGRQAHFLLLLTGAVIAELGFVACAPSLVGLVGRLGARLPLSLRFAARDAARHRSRTGPAVGAVVAAVAGSVAVSVYLASDTERQRVEYRPRYPAGTVWVLENGPVNRIPRATIDAVAAALPVRERIPVESLGEECGGGRECGAWELEAPPAYRCDGLTMTGCATNLRNGLVAVAPPELAEWATGTPDERVATALRNGAVAVFDSRWVTDGKVTVGRIEQGTADRKTAVRLPAVVLDAPPYDGTPIAILTPETARRHRLPSLPSATVFTTTRGPTEAEESAARGAATRGGEFVDLYVERGFRPANPLALLVLVAASTIVTVGATGMATGLAAADSRPDLATLAAVGAPPRVRRRLAMAQAATVAALGTGLGILAGLVPSVAVVAARAEFPFVTPWAALAATAVGVPLLAALLVGAVTRSRLPLERRLA